MHVGVMIFDTDYSMPVNELAVALEERGFESLFVPEHTHIPASRESAVCKTLDGDSSHFRVSARASETPPARFTFR